MPPKSASVTVRFAFAKIEGAVEDVLSSRIIHTIPEIAAEGRLGSFGVKFEEPILKVRVKRDSAISAFVSAIETSLLAQLRILALNYVLPRPSPSPHLRQ